MIKRFRNLIVVAFYLLFWGWFSTHILNQLIIQSSNHRIYQNASDIPPQNVGLVLGTSRYLNSGHENVYFTYRIDAAAKLYHTGKVKKLIVSGDNGHKSYDETTDMKEALQAKGIPAKAIVEDYAGFRTLDSVIRAKKVFGQQRMIIVSQEYHLYRAIFIARTNGIYASGLAAKDPAHKASLKYMKKREYLARINAFLDCTIFRTHARFEGPPEKITF